jgi:hypothetical protein
MSSRGVLQRDDLIAAVYSLGPGGSVSLIVLGYIKKKIGKMGGYVLDPPT